MSASTQGSVFVSLQIVYTQRADGVEDREHHHADICKDGRPHVGRAKGNERKAGKLHHEGKDDVLIDNADALAGDFDGLCDLQRLVIHEDDVGGFDGRIRAHCAHGDPDIGTREDRRVVDAVADEGELCFAGLLRKQRLDLLDLTRGQKIGVNLVHTELLRNAVCNLFRIARQHDGFRYARAVECLDSLFGVGLYHVGDHNVPGVLPIDGHVDDRADAVAVDEVNAQLLHELMVACGDRYTVNLRENAPAADLFDIRDAAAVNFFAIRLLQALADGMGRGALGKRRVLQKLLLLQRAVVDGADLKDALRQRAGLIKDDGLDLRECLQVIRALDENAFLARPADAREEAQRDTYHERAPAARN